MYTTIRITRKTKEILTRELIRLENELGRRLDYDEAIRILIERSRPRRPELLLRLKKMKVSEHIVSKAHEMLEEEAKLEEEFFERRYGARYKRTC